MKRKLAALLGIGLMSVSLVACNSQATENKSTTDPNVTEQNSTDETGNTNEDMAGESLLQWGKIISVDKESGQIVIEDKNMPAEEGNADFNKIVLNTSGDKTAFVNAETGEKVSIDDLKEGDEIYAWVSIAFTASEPPQTFAYVIATNTAVMTPPKYIGVTSVEKTDAGLFLTDTMDEKWDLTDVESKNITAYEDGKEINPTTIKANSTCLIWPANVPVTEGSDTTVLKATRLIVLQ